MLRRRQRRSLSVDDQTAVDLLLDLGAHPKAQVCARHAPSVPPKRLLGASKLLEILAQMPVAEPPSDLVAKTLRGIEIDIATHGSHTAQQYKPGPQIRVH